VPARAWALFDDKAGPKEGREAFPVQECLQGRNVQDSPPQVGAAHHAPEQVIGAVGTKDRLAVAPDYRVVVREPGAIKSRIGIPISLWQILALPRIRTDKPHLPAVGIVGVEIWVISERIVVR